jgi:4'-phosphopantetheinyl transferase
MKTRIDVWTFEVEQFEKMATSEVLSAEEKQRAAHFHFERDRLCYTVSHTLLRQVLSKYTQRAASDIEILTERNGRPYVAERSIEFNLSHTDKLTAIAVCTSPVGVDVERVRQVGEPLPALIGREDAETIAHLKQSDRQVAFFQCWARKEALLKATGMGLLENLERVSVGIGPNSEIVSSIAEIDAWRWRVLDLHVPEGFAGAVACEADEAEVAYRDVRALLAGRSR